MRSLRRRSEDRSALAPEMASALSPVARALLSSSRTRANERIAAAESDVRAELLAAEREASRVVAQATAETTESEERAAASRLATARREAHEAILSARRQAYEALRDAALQALLALADSPEGCLLAQRMEGLVLERIGDGATMHGAKDVDTVPRLSTVAESGHRRARLEAISLVDAVLETMPARIEQLWS
jgi:vacuolar-type H+-ATPase subunit E/Vma4